MDDSALREYAKRHGFTGTYIITRQGTHWRAEIKAKRGGAVIAWVGSSTIEGAQAALDRALSTLIYHLEQKPVSEAINLTDQRKAGK